MKNKDKDEIKITKLIKGIYWIGDPKKLKITDEEVENHQMKLFDVGDKTVNFFNTKLKYNKPIEVKHTGRIGIFNINVLERQKKLKAGTLFWALDDFNGTFMVGDPLEVYEWDGTIYVGNHFELRLT